MLIPLEISESALLKYIETTPARTKKNNIITGDIKKPFFIDFSGGLTFILFLVNPLNNFTQTIITQCRASTGLKHMEKTGFLI